MKDRRSVDDLSISELQRVLSEKKRIAREARLARYRETGRAVHLPIGTAPEALAPGQDEPRRRAPRSWPRRFFDFFLLIVEVGAVLGLVYVLYNGSEILAQLNREANQNIAAALPSFTATPIITAVVLPSGHTPPTTSE